MQYNKVSELKDKGNLFYKDKNYKEAIAKYKECISEFNEEIPNEFRSKVFLNLSLCLYMQTQYKESLEYAEKSWKCDNYNAKAKYRICMNLYELKRYGESITKAYELVDEFKDDKVYKDLYNKIAEATKKATMKEYTIKEIDAEPLEKLVQLIVDINAYSEEDFKNKRLTLEKDIIKFVKPLESQDFIKNHMKGVSDPILKYFVILWLFLDQIYDKHGNEIIIRLIENIFTMLVDRKYDFDNMNYKSACTRFIDNVMTNPTKNKYFPGVHQLFNQYIITNKVIDRIIEYYNSYDHITINVNFLKFCMRLVEYVSLKFNAQFLYIFTKILARVEMFEIGMESSWLFVLSKVIDSAENTKVDFDHKLFFDFTKVLIKLFYRKYTDFPKDFNSYYYGRQKSFISIYLKVLSKSNIDVKLFIQEIQKKLITQIDMVDTTDKEFNNLDYVILMNIVYYYNKDTFDELYSELDQHLITKESQSNSNLSSNEYYTIYTNNYLQNKNINEKLQEFISNDHLEQFKTNFNNLEELDVKDVKNKEAVSNLVNSQISNLKTYSLIFKENRVDYIYKNKETILLSFISIAKILKSNYIDQSIFMEASMLLEYLIESFCIFITFKDFKEAFLLIYDCKLFIELIDEMSRLIKSNVSKENIENKFMFSFSIVSFVYSLILNDESIDLNKYLNYDEDKEQQKMLKSIVDYNNKLKEIEKGKRDQIFKLFEFVTKSQLLSTCIEIIELNEKLIEKNVASQTNMNLNIEVSLNFMIDVFYELSFFKDFRRKLMQMKIIDKISSLISMSHNESIKLKSWLVIFRIVSSTAVAILPDLYKVTILNGIKFALARFKDIHELFCFETLMALINVLADEEYRSQINNSSEMWELIFRAIFQSNSLRLLRVGCECFCNISLMENVKTFIGLGQNNASIKFLLAYMILSVKDYEYSDLKEINNVAEESKFMNEAILGTLANLSEVNQVNLCLLEKPEYVSYILGRIVKEETSEIQKLAVILKGLLTKQKDNLYVIIGSERIKMLVEDFDDKVQATYYGEDISEFLKEEIEEIKDLLK